jgi:hypothetical protein
MTNKVSNAFTLIRGKFCHVALIAGPQFAANIEVRGVAGRLEVTELNRWSWTPLSGAPGCTLTDRDLESLADPIEVCENLFRSAQDSMIEMQHEMYSRLEHASRNRDTTSVLLGNSMTEVVLNEVFRLPGQPVAPKSTSVM